MKIVVDIPNSLYANLRIITHGSPASKRLLECMKEGIPLPKHHGDLIDRGQALKECYDITIDGDVFTVVQYETLLGVPTIIEADKAESEV